jgi:hypothetical protein
MQNSQPSPSANFTGENQSQIKELILFFPYCSFTEPKVEPTNVNSILLSLRVLQHLFEDNL